MAEHKPLFSLYFLLFLLPSLSHPKQDSQLINPIDLSSLLTIKSALSDLPGSGFFSTWNFNHQINPCTTFSGLICSNTRVISLTLGTGLSDSPGLTGSLPSSLANLSALTELILYSGTVSGPIPSQLGSLKNLRVISLAKNRFIGSIPTSIATLPNLHTLDLSFNLLTGSIPPSLTGLPSLRVLILSSNRLTGQLPHVSTQLLHLDVKYNRLSGLLPELPSSLRYLSVSENQMWGPLEKVASLSELVYLDLSMNQFNGTIPQSLFTSTLSSLFLQRNNLSGEIPFLPSAVRFTATARNERVRERTHATATATTLYVEIDDEAGSIVDLSHNALTGEVSPGLAGVESLFLNNNHLKGHVPVEYVRSVNKGTMKTLYLQHNYLTGFPLPPGAVLPNSVCLCLSYNCMVVPPAGFSSCPTNAGMQHSRPVYECGEIYNRTDRS